ncbi:hypothetical protein GCM10009860_11530 [Microbacterium mitrae]|uniref:Uncharacterized protein n=1 Tax=Microbacterium mitrae TaxID=664640 RepID=A0A5C8HT21_9MICO|nr:hypothetical protein [Microbacterium mitrae]TXK06469.1 hypothetical protein FVP60_05825 [Microbacterium mitrae]
MTDRACINGCIIPAQHFAACPDYGTQDATCQGCVPASAADGILICHRCRGRLTRALEAIPALLSHLRELTDTHSVRTLKDTRRSVEQGTLAPVDVDILDAMRDLEMIIGLTLHGQNPTAPEILTRARELVWGIIAQLPEIANDHAALTEWWNLTVAATVPDHPGFWTVNRVRNRWPLVDRRRHAGRECVVCDLKYVVIVPPSRGGAPTWYQCTNCHWERNDLDEDGLYAAVYGPYNEREPLVSTGIELDSQRWRRTTTN